MTSNQQEQPFEDKITSKQADPPKVSESSIPQTSATTNDSPEFGWSAYAERVNGRFAMIGFSSILLIEIFSHQGFLKWAGLIN